MFWSRIAGLAFAAAFAPTIHAQESGWQENQVNATMCTWKGLRAAQIKDTVYLDGGYLYWVAGLADGTYDFPHRDGNPLGLIYTLNFSTPFDLSTNATSIFGNISKSGGGAANNLAPNYYDGAMLANYDEFFLYGGLLTQVDSYDPPDGDNVLSYQISQYGPEHTFSPGFLNVNLPDNFTRYVTYGGAANAPSENKAFYFGGNRSPTWGPIYYPVNASTSPTNVSDTLITLDMGSQTSPEWKNDTLPSDIPSRSNPSMVWVPVGEQGILVVLGGVSYPEYDNTAQTSQNEAQSEKDSPTYMANVDIYDIASGKWYQQPTIAAPPPYAMGCAVVAPAQDFSSYNIYYYGGYDGIHSDEGFNDDVWILSLPSFMWMKVSSGNSSHARAGHQCVMPYPDQMVTIGGFRSGGTNCLENVLGVFNLTEGKWLDSYNPDAWDEYGVPEMIHLMIGGDYSGGATMTTPTPTGWATPELASVFATTYPASKIQTSYPYGSMGPGNNTRGDYNNGGGGGGGTPSWVGPVLGVVLGLVFVTAIVVAVMLYRRRKLLRKREGSDQHSSNDNNNRILSWVRGQNSEKAGTVTSEEPVSYEDPESRNITPGLHRPLYPQGPPGQQPEMRMAHQLHYEMPAEPLVELGDTSLPPEIGGTALSHEQVIEKHTRVGSKPNSPAVLSPPSNLSFNTGNISRDQPSSISTPPPAGTTTTNVSSTGPTPPPYADPTPSSFQPQQRPDSPSLGATTGEGAAASTTTATSPPPPSQFRGAVVSDLSSVGDREASHLRNVSNATVSSAGSPEPGQQRFGAISPPDGDASDYGSVHGGGGRPMPGPSGSVTGNPFRRSVFRESTEDLGEPHAR
ncbi:hypothetical protein F4780DRAFT_296077 [Xylariomycetidae sp. FL0641]|nr:hypothetical protein F4780DRAFT_296077 [Xylariomycetidae sp. FL0641]